MFPCVHAEKEHMKSNGLPYQPEATGLQTSNDYVYYMLLPFVTNVHTPKWTINMKPKQTLKNLETVDFTLYTVNNITYSSPCNQPSPSFAIATQTLYLSALGPNPCPRPNPCSMPNHDPSYHLALTLNRIWPKLAIPNNDTKKLHVNHKEKLKEGGKKET